MKLKVTKREIRNNTRQLYSFGYCAIQSLLYYQSPFAYSCGVYGWSCDYYDINGVILCTGYSPVGADVDYKMARKYEKKAENIIYSSEFSYEQRKRKLNNLLNKFIKGLLNNAL